MNKPMQLLRSTLCVLMFVGSASAFAGQNILYYLSEPGDFIAQGRELTLTGADGTFSAPYPYPYSAYLRFDGFGGSHSLSLTLVTSDYANLQPGAYENAVRSGYQSPGHPGLDFGGDGRSCYTLTCRFDVLEIVRDANGLITQFAANFEQHCSGVVPALFGQIRFNSDVPVI